MPDKKGLSYQMKADEVRPAECVKSEARLSPVDVAAISLLAIACGVLAIRTLLPADSDKRACGHDNDSQTAGRMTLLTPFVVCNPLAFKINA